MAWLTDVSVISSHDLYFPCGLAGLAALSIHMAVLVSVDAFLGENLEDLQQPGVPNGPLSSLGSMGQCSTRESLRRADTCRCKYGCGNNAVEYRFPGGIGGSWGPHSSAYRGSLIRSGNHGTRRWQTRAPPQLHLAQWPAAGL